MPTPPRRSPADQATLKQIGERLRDARKAATLTLDEAAKRLGKSRYQGIHDHEVARYEVGAVDLRAYCTLYDVSSDLILGLSSSPNIRGGGGIVDVKKWSAIMGDNIRTLRDAEKAVRAVFGRDLNELLEERNLTFGIATPKVFEVVAEDEWAPRRQAWEAKIKRLLHEKGARR